MGGPAEVRRGRPPTTDRSTTSTATWCRTTRGSVARDRGPDSTDAAAPSLCTRRATTSSLGVRMFEWSEEQLMIRDAVRQFVEAEIAPKREELEHGDLPPYDILRKLFATFGMDAMARERFKAQIEREKRIAAGEEEAPAKGERRGGGDPNAIAMTMLPDHRALPALARHGHGHGRVSMGLTSAAIMSQGHDRAEGAVGARPADAREGRRVGHHRARLRVRRLRVDEVDRPARRRRVPPERLEDLHHQRPLRRHDRVHLQARRGQPAGRAQDPVVRARPGDAGLRAVEAAAQDGHALVADRRAVPRRRPGRA